MDDLSVDRSIRHWWVLLVRGILFIAVGIYMLASPATSFVVLGFLFGLVIFLAGLVELLHVTRDKHPTNRGWHLALGIIDLILGVVFMAHIATSVAILRIIVGLWFVFRGISLFRFSRVIRHKWVMQLGGVLTAIFGLLIIFNAAFGSLTVIVFMAMAFIIAGLFNAALGFSMKQVSH
jgi:uncharacterized membrane protein HdeD (DUF308 family)